MSLIATFEIETPILREALAAAPAMQLRTEALHAMGDRSPKAMVWMCGDDFEAFERGLEEDSTIARYEALTSDDDRRLYRVTLTEEGETAFTYPAAAEHDVVLLDMHGTRERLEVRARFPSRDALLAYREACRERDVTFRLEQLYHEEQVAGDGGLDSPYGVTDAQCEALVTAMDEGYFEVPRGATLEDIAEQLGVTRQALSTRLRRGQENLLQHTVYRNREE